MLNRIWLAFFFIGILVALYPLLAGDWQYLHALPTAIFSMAKLSAEIALGLIGLMCFWLGLFRVGQDAGLVALFARALSPLFARLMPEVPPNHPAIGSVTMNLMANMLGLDNAATPLGLKAMADLQTLNPQADTASNAQILFLVLNCSSVTLIPVSIFMLRAQMGAASPAEVFLPILLATACSTLGGLLVVAWIQKINVLDRVLLVWLAVLTLLASVSMSFLLGLSSVALQNFSMQVAVLAVVAMLLLFLGAGAVANLNAYESFIQGAKEGFASAMQIIPYLVAMLVAVGVFRESGAMALALDALKKGVMASGVDHRWVDAMPVALMKPLSGSGARALMLETMQHYGVDSFAGRLSAIVQGSTETTFYVLSVYFGSVGIVKIRYALWCGLLADLVGVVASIAVCYWFYGQ